ncbi:hypothetical protein [uncultured Kordia sp.]|uniref:hypothetical protein n=1 Tax=uncultured Kordia sp. TaxID=507699 RepID=UPI00262394A2|nr:hypothetical protein [uncultured Kordia sp.]
MKRQKTTVFTLLSEELDSQTLMNLFGGTNAGPVNNNPHDLITPTSSAKPYEEVDVDDW